MSLPLCPVCGLRDVPRIDGAAVIRLTPACPPLRYSVTVLRSYRCNCGWSYQTSETIDRLNPECLWVRKLAKDEADAEVDIPPAG